MANLSFDFLHNYVTGERRASDPADAYQYDEGHVLEAVVPVAVTSCEIQYWIRGMEKADAYTPTSITQNTDNTYTILGNIPNSYFETNGDLRVYIVVTDGDASITTYEGYIHIKERQMPEDYVDDDPDNDAVQIIAAARGYAETSEAWAVGQINGEDVPSTADQYQNNASYYAGQAASAASSAAAQASLAPAYDNTATYEVGDYSLYSGQLYECTTAITTAEAWTAAHWTAVTVGSELSNLKNDLYNTLVTDTATGAIASFPDGADGVPVKSLSVAIEPVQSGTGDPSPTNVRPISGWTGANVNVTGINAWDEEWEFGGYSEADGSKVEQATLRNTNPIPVKPSTAYYFKFGSGTKFRVVYLDADQHFISTSLVNVNNAYTTPVNCAYVNFNSDTAYGTTYNHDISINYPATDTDYHAYNGSSVSVNWTTEAGTIYGGTLDVTTGMLTVDRAYYTTTLSTKDNVATGTYDQYIFYSRWTGGYISTEVDADASIRPICNIAPYLYSNAQTSTRFYVTSTGFQVFVPSGTAETTAVEIAYFLKEPFEVTLTAQEVRTLLGQNNVFADCGDVSVEYRADTKLYINKVLNA